MATNNLPRGLRNNNPLNLRISNNAWLGKVQRNTDGVFEQFTSMVFGLRAAMINIRTIIRRLKQQGKAGTVAQVIHVWAPASDGNNEAAYVSNVSYLANISSHAIIDYKDKASFCALVAAMAVVECGRHIDDAFVESAYCVAFPRLL